MVAKAFNSCIALRSYIVTICINITSILTTQGLLKSGDIEINPECKKSSAVKFWGQNLSKLAPHYFVKVPLIEAFITTQNFDIVCLYETFLDSTMPRNHKNININGYSLLKVDHPNSTKQGGVCMHFNESLRLIRLTNMQKYLN